MAAPRPASAASRPPASTGEYLRAAFLASPAMMAITRLHDGVLLDANPAFLEAAGLSAETALGRPIHELGLWVDEERRLEYRRLLQTQQRVKDFEARFHTGRGADRDIMINADVIAIDGIACAVVVALDITDRRQREREQAALFRLSAAALEARDRAELFQRMHQIVGEVLPARSFFIALYDRAAGEVCFPLWVNEISAAIPPPRPPGRHLTDYVLTTGKPLLLTDAQMAAFTRETGHTPAAYGQCRAWLGTPLLIEGRPAGVIAMQNYQDPAAYRAEDIRLLDFVAGQIAAALVRHEAEAARRLNEARQRESQEYFAKSFFSNPAAVTLSAAADGRLIEVNAAFLALSGLTREEAIGRTTGELGLWVDETRHEEFLHQLATHGHVRDFEAQIRGRHGTVRDILFTTDVMEMNGRACVLNVGLDVTDRRRRDREQAAIYRLSEAAREAADRPALFARVHAVLADLMPARNFFVALLNPEQTELSFPYFADEVTASPRQRPLASYLADYVIKTRAPLLLRHDEVRAFRERTGFAPRFGWSKVWLGAPLFSGRDIVGAIAVQDYHDARAYRPEDVAFFEFVAGQIGAALRRYEADEARRRLEARQRETQEYFAKSFQASPALMALAEVADGRIIDANPAFLRASGYTRAEVVGRTSLELGIWPVPEDRALFMDRLRAHGSVRNHEAVFHTKDAEPRYVSLNADVFEMEGRPCMLITAIDLTERHRREQVQAATYEISQAVLAGGDLATLFTGVHRIIAGLMPAGNFYVALRSEDGQRIEFPYFVDEHAAGQPPAQPPERSPGLGFTEHVLATGQPVLITQAELARLLSARGDYRPPQPAPLVRLGAPLRLAGRAIGVIAVHDYRDPDAFGAEELRLLAFVADQVALAVQRQQTAAALAQAEQQFRGIFENAVEGLYQTTPEGRFLRANPAMARILGFASPEALVAAYQDLGRQLYADPGRRAEFLALVRTTDTIPDFESEVIRADGSRIRLNESVRVVRDATGAIRHFEGVAIDVTANHERARALREARDAADAANRAKSHFLASMSHELRTPLNGILGYTQILRRDPALNDRQRTGVGVIHQSAEHLLALINDVLDLAKIEARKLELHLVDFDLPEFAHGVADFFAPRAREKNLLLECAFAPDLPRVVRGDPQRLRQVVFNLLSNAIKFTTAGGVVFSVERAGPALRFSVSDTGPGISEPDQARLFEPFLQLGDAGQRASGTGLGLNVSRSLLEQMGATLRLESRPGWGTRFWFDVTLPAVADTAPNRPALPARRQTGYTGPRRRVLVADDHAPNRTLLADLLAPLGFEVETAADGAEAVACARARRPDLVLLDLRMPKLDGFATARAIRAAHPADPPCLLAISASADEAHRQAALAAGCADFLPKPLREEDLFRLMEQHLGLTWITSDAPAAETNSPFPHLPHPPAPAEAEALFDLASKGDVIGVRTYAQQLAARDPRLASFAHHVIDLTARFKMKAIRQYVARYRAGAAGPDAAP